MLTVENVKIYPKLDFYFENIELKGALENPAGGKIQNEIVKYG